MEWGAGATVAAVTVATALGWPSDAKEIQPWDVGTGARIPFPGLPAWHLIGQQETETWANPGLWCNWTA